MICFEAKGGEGEKVLLKLKISEIKLRGKNSQRDPRSIFHKKENCFSFYFFQLSEPNKNINQIYKINIL